MEWIKQGIGNLIKAEEGRADRRRLETELNQALVGYPGNHTYRVAKGKLIASLDLSKRYRQIAKLLPERIGKLLDVGTCKGFFVLAVSARPDCEMALGIDVHEPFVATAMRVREVLARSKAR